MNRGIEDNYSASQPSDMAPLDYSLDPNHQPNPNSTHFSRQQEGSGAADYTLSSTPSLRQISFDKLNFADVMQFADFGPKLALNQSRMSSDDENYFLKFQLLGGRSQEEPPPLPLPSPPQGDEGPKEDSDEEEEEGRFSENTSSVQFLGGGGKPQGIGVKNRRKRPRSMKTSEEVESQRMTHIAVERNRRRQMNEHLRVLRSLMPGSYVQRGDQASIIGGAIEFVRELEQLLQCLESQKRRRLVGGGGEAPRTMNDGAPLLPFFPPLPLPGGDPARLLELDQGGVVLREEMAENKSSLADIEVRLLGLDAFIKILSRRRPGQLIKIIAALEDLQFSILHTNITTIEQTVLYSFNVKITDEMRCTAEDIASSVQQILSFIDASTLM